MRITFFIIASRACKRNKKEIVKAYLNGQESYPYLAKKYIVPDKKPIQQWVTAYQAFGEEGLMHSRKNETYTFEFKIHVVELYLSTEVSYQKLALSVGMKNPPLISKWVIDYRTAGPDALRPKRKGRHSKCLNQMKTIL